MSLEKRLVISLLAAFLVGMAVVVYTHNYVLEFLSMVFAGKATDEILKA